MAKIKIIFNKKLSTLSILFSVIILSIIIGFGFHFVFAAWTGPGTNPPGSNVNPPITEAGGQTINGNLTLSGDLTVNGGDITGANGTIINVGATDAEGIYIIDDGTSYPEVHCRHNGSGGANTLCEFRSGAFFNSTQLVYITPELIARGGISDDGGDLDLNDNVNITGNLTVSGTIAGGSSAVYDACYEKCGTTGRRTTQPTNYPSCPSSPWVQANTWSEVYMLDAQGYDIVKDCVACCLPN